MHLFVTDGTRHVSMIKFVLRMFWWTIISQSMVRTSVLKINLVLHMKKCMAVEKLFVRKCGESLIFIQRRILEAQTAWSCGSTKTTQTNMFRLIKAHMEMHIDQQPAFIFILSHFSCTDMSYRILNL